MENNDLATRIQKLERELALKNAYLSISVHFPKGNKIPQDVKDEVTTVVRELCTKLAENKEVSVDTPSQGVGQFSDEEAAILKSVVQSILNKKSPVVNGTQIPANAPVVTATNTAQVESVDMGLRKARIITLEGIPNALRNRMAPEEEVYVKSVKGDKALITNKYGQTGYVPVDNLEMQ